MTLSNAAEKRWPQSTFLPAGTRYYLGTLPPVPLPPHLLLAHRRLISRVVMAWHTASTRVAGRVWGAYLRRVRGSLNAGSCSPGRATVDRASLPVHLLHLLEDGLA